MLEMPGRCVDCILPACNLVARRRGCTCVPPSRVSGQRARWGARISCELAPWPRHAQTTTLHGDATEFYYRPSDPQGRLSAPTYPITDGVVFERNDTNVVKTEIANPVSLRRQGSA